MTKNVGTKRKMSERTRRTRKSAYIGMEPKVDLKHIEQTYALICGEWIKLLSIPADFVRCHIELSGIDMAKSMYPPYDELDIWWSFNYIPTLRDIEIKKE